MYCNVCKKDIDKSEWHIHIDSDKHRRKLFKILVKDYSPGEEYKPLEANDDFRIIEQNSKFNKKFNSWMIDYKIQISPNININKVNDILNESINYIKKLTSFRDGDKMNIIITSPILNNPISTGLKTINERGNSILNELGNRLVNILTSNEDIALEDCNFHVQVIPIPQGQGKTKIINLKEDTKTKQCITVIKNDDNLCGPRSIVTGLTYYNPDIFVKLNLANHPLTNNEITYIRKSRKLQKDLAIKLLQICGISIPEPSTGLTIEDIKKIEQKLDIQIKVVCAEKLNSIIYSGPDKDIKIYLYKNKNHFDVINSMAAFFGSSYYCHECDTKYNNKDQHICKKEYRCNVCNGEKHPEHVIENPKWKYCGDCFRSFFNMECFKNHKSNETCDTVWKCKKCKKILLRKNTNPKIHKCGEKNCLNCKETVLEDHKCYMLKKLCKGGYCKEMIPCCLPLKSDKCYSCKTYTEKYIFFDYEATQETGIHIPNLIVVHDFNGEEKIFNKNDDFCKWLISKENKGLTAIAHNAKGYDSQFILKYCVENTMKPYTIYNGTKLMLLEIEHLNIKIIDSMNFIAQPLSSLPKTFGLQELKKGYFPHYFNKKCNENYVGDYPSKRHYGYDQMKSEQRQQFSEWYDKKVNEKYVFDMKKELLEYCRSDVDILRKACLKLRKEFLEIANIDPFQYLTIASVCMAIYRSKYLKHHTIAVVDKEQKDTYSKESICWLDYLMHKNNIKIRHALNGGEKVILGKKVDGYSEETNTVYQFHGCFWHGCSKCFDPNTINNKNKKTMKDLYEKTLEISNEIRKEYNLIEIWECDYKNDNDIKKFSKNWNNEVITELNPRDAFFGGRTNATKLLYKNMKHKIRYIDVCSLYPTVQFYDYYPIGHPIKIFNPDLFDSNWYGFIKCKVIPPKGLYHPVLPVKLDKLLFPLCMNCAKTKQVNKCLHSDKDRSIIGTWTTDEVSKAIEKGYKIENIYEVWHFNEKSNDLFKDYVKDFMKIKLETSPWNNDFNDIDEYIDTIKQKLDICLDKEKIQNNPGKRAVAKICLNSLWGKFGQRQNMSKTEYVTDIKRFYEILLDDRLDNINLNFINEDMVQMSYCFKDYYVENDYNTNIFIAAFTTSSARLRLYKMLEYLEDKVAYYDTDSIVYIDDGTKEVKTGCLLGDWTDELKGNHITDWVSTGPKSYAYIDNNSIEVCKIKGFYLNYENSRFINFKLMDKMVKKECKGVTTIDENKITRDSKTKNIVNKYQEKFFSFDYDKRVINKIDNEHIDTLPYGY